MGGKSNVLDVDLGMSRSTDKWKLLGSGPTSTDNPDAGRPTMRFMVSVKADKESEAGSAETRRWPRWASSTKSW